MSLPQELLHIQRAVWGGSLPLQVRLAPADCRTYDQSDPYLIQFSRLSYLPVLLPRLLNFFASSLIDASASADTAWFSFEDVPLKWHYPAGLLYDLFSGVASSQHSHDRRQLSPDESQFKPLPWCLVLHFSDMPENIVQLDKDEVRLHDAWRNSAKEADFLRNGSTKAIMSLSKSDSEKMWEAVKENNFPAWNAIHSRLLPASTSLRYIPIRFYLPYSLPSTKNNPTSPLSANPESSPNQEAAATVAAGHFKVVQVQVTPYIGQTRTQQTLGSALKAALPSVFQSSRTALIARPVLHGAVAPMSMVLEDAIRTLAFTDGWLHVGIDMLAD